MSAQIRSHTRTNRHPITAFSLSASPLVYEELNALLTKSRGNVIGYSRMLQIASARSRIRASAPIRRTSRLRYLRTQVANRSTYFVAVKERNTDDRTTKEILAAARFMRPSIADQVPELISLQREDPDVDPLDLDTLRLALQCLVVNPTAPDPSIGLTSEGYVSLEWAIEPDGLLALLFLPDGKVIYAGGVGDEPQIKGMISNDKVNHVLRRFEDRLTKS